jgi:hypothetical protein
MGGCRAAAEQGAAADTWAEADTRAAADTQAAADTRAAHESEEKCQKHPQRPKMTCTRSNNQKREDYPRRSDRGHQKKSPLWAPNLRPQ